MLHLNIEYKLISMPLSDCDDARDATSPRTAQASLLSAKRLQQEEDVRDLLKPVLKGGSNGHGWPNDPKMNE